MRTIIFATAFAVLATPAMSAESPVMLSVPSDGVEFMARLEVATRKVCGPDTKSLYYRKCAEDVDAVTRASLPVASRRAFRIQRMSAPSAFPVRSFKVF